VDYTITKKGECQAIGFVASFIDDAFTPGGEKLLEPVADLLGQSICSPAMKGGCFLPDYVSSERTHLVDAIAATRNDQREYADLRLLEELCRGERYSVSRLGDQETAEKLTGEEVYRAYTDLLESAPMELFYCGGAEENRVVDAFSNAFAKLPRKSVRPLPQTVYHKGRTEVLKTQEVMDVSQGKLGMGFSCGSDNFSALLLGNTIFGGSTNSKLFMNVREKMSLCYYASSLFHWKKSLMTVSSGIEFENFQRAYDEILSQLQHVQNGDIQDWELEAARSTLCTIYATVGDSQAKLENFWLGWTAMGLKDTPESLMAGIKNVTRDEICQAMQTVNLDTVYFLQGEEAAQ
jgi:predicted Zn-dependent peptidase